MKSRKTKGVGTSHAASSDNVDEEGLKNNGDERDVKSVENPPPYHHFKLPSSVLSKRQRPPANSNSGLNSGIYQKHAMKRNVNQSSSLFTASSSQGNGDSPSNSTSGTTAVNTTGCFNIVDETDKTTQNLNRKKRRKKRNSTSSKSSSHNKDTIRSSEKGAIHSTSKPCEEEDGSPDSNNSEERNETLKVYAFEKPLLDNNLTFKDNYFILTPVSNAQQSSNHSHTNRNSSPSLNRNNSFSPSQLQPLTTSTSCSPQFQPQISPQSTPTISTPNSSTCSLTPTIVQSQSPSDEFQSNYDPRKHLKVLIPQSSNDSTLASPSTKRLLVSEPNLTVFERTSPLNQTPVGQCTISPFDSVNQEQEVNNLSLQLFSQLVQQLIQRYQIQLDELLQSPTSLIQNILMGLNDNNNVNSTINQYEMNHPQNFPQEFQNTNFSTSTIEEESNPPSNLLQLSIEDLLSNQNTNVPNSTQDFQSSVSIEEIFAFILQNQNLLSQQQQNNQQ